MCAFYVDPLNQFCVFSRVFCAVSEAAGRGCSKIRVSLCVGLLLWFTNVYKFAIWEAITVGTHQLRYAANWVTRTLLSSSGINYICSTNRLPIFKSVFYNCLRSSSRWVLCKVPTPIYRVFEFGVILVSMASAISCETWIKILQFHYFIVYKFLFILHCMVTLANVIMMLQIDKTERIKNWQVLKGFYDNLQDALLQYYIM